MKTRTLLVALLFFGSILLMGCPEEPTGKATGEPNSTETIESCTPHWECFSSGARQKVYDDCSKSLPQACSTNLCCAGNCQTASCYRDSDCGQDKVCFNPASCEAECIAE